MKKTQSKTAGKTPTGKTYVFRTVQEIATQLTENQIEDFLIDFRQWLYYCKGNPLDNSGLQAIFGLAKIAAKIEGKDVKDVISADTEKMSWFDDGKHETKEINIRMIKK